MTPAEIQSAYASESQKLPTYSGKMSELCKFVWAGSMATLFAVMTAAPDSTAAKFYSDNHYFMIGAAAAGSIAFLLDYLQNVTVYCHYKGLVHWIEGRTKFFREEYNQQTQSNWLAVAHVLFIVKNVCALAAAMLLALAVIHFI